MQCMKKIIFCFCFFVASIAHAEDALKVVTTLSSYADIAKSVGGDAIEVFSIARPRFNPHFIEARPSDVFKLKQADLFIHSGLDLEAWREPLLDAAARSELRTGGLRELDLSKGILILEVPEKPLSRAEGDIHIFGNPHYWLDPRNGLIIAKAIAEKLAELDPSHTAKYQKNLEVFQGTLRAKIAEWNMKTANLHGKEVLGYHNEWVYLMQFLGLTMKEFVEPKPGIPPTPKHLEELEDMIQRRGIKALIQASFYSKDASEFLTEHTGIKAVTICQNAGELPECKDYISMIDFAVSKLTEAYDG